MCDHLFFFNAIVVVFITSIYQRLPFVVFENRTVQVNSQDRCFTNIWLATNIALKIPNNCSDSQHYICEDSFRNFTVFFRFYILLLKRVYFYNTFLFSLCFQCFWMDSPLLVEHWTLSAWIEPDFETLQVLNIGLIFKYHASR